MDVDDNMVEMCTWCEVEREELYMGGGLYVYKCPKCGGYDVEIDVWCFGDGGYWLGHDKPQYHIDESFLHNKKLWCHAKNIQGLYSMLEDSIHCFWHQEDDVTLTSEGYLWTYPGKDLTPNSISVLPDNKPDVEVAGVCSDFIVRFV